MVVHVSDPVEPGPAFEWAMGRWHGSLREPDPEIRILQKECSQLRSRHVRRVMAVLRPSDQAVLWAWARGDMPQYCRAEGIERGTGNTRAWRALQALEEAATLHPLSPEHAEVIRGR